MITRRAAGSAREESPSSSDDETTTGRRLAALEASLQQLTAAIQGMQAAQTQSPSLLHSPVENPTEAPMSFRELAQLCRHGLSDLNDEPDAVETWLRTAERHLGSANDQDKLDVVRSKLKGPRVAVLAKIPYESWDEFKTELLTVLDPVGHRALIRANIDSGERYKSLSPIEAAHQARADSAFLKGVAGDVAIINALRKVLPINVNMAVDPDLPLKDQVAAFINLMRRAKTSGEYDGWADKPPTAVLTASADTNNSAEETRRGHDRSWRRRRGKAKQRRSWDNVQAKVSPVNVQPKDNASDSEHF